MSIVLLVGTIRIVFSGQLFEGIAMFLHQEADYLLNGRFLFGRASSAGMEQSVGDDFFEYSTLLGTFTLVQETVEIAVEESLVVQDTVDVDVVVLAGVVLDGKGGSHHKEKDQS